MFSREAKLNFLENQIPVIQFVFFTAKHSSLLHWINLNVNFCEPAETSFLDFLNVFRNVVTEYYFVSLRGEMLINRYKHEGFDTVKGTAKETA